ncbi:MAG TPA: hypothetical protein V6C97_07315 [Oculatellaceae cyanobacterium]
MVALTHQEILSGRTPMGEQTRMIFTILQLAHSLSDGSLTNAATARKCAPTLMPLQSLLWRVAVVNPDAVALAASTCSVISI